MAALFSDEPTARGVLAQIGFPRHLIPEWDSPSSFWLAAVYQLEQGFGVAGGITVLLAETAARYPGNAEVRAMYASVTRVPGVPFAANPELITNREELGQALKALCLRTGATADFLAAELGCSPSTIRVYLRGERMPSLDAFIRLLWVCGVDGAEAVPWNAAFQRVSAAQRGPATRRPRRLGPQAVPAPEQPQDHDPSLLLSIYIPGDRLYAAEQRRVLTLFRDWLARTRKHGIRQCEHSTSQGSKFEFHADGSVTLPELREEIDVFAHVLNLCADSPAGAMDVLSEAGMSEAGAGDLVREFRREARRVEKDARQAREHRMLALRQDLEDRLFELDIDLGSTPGAQLAAQLDAMLDKLVPRPDTAASVQALTVSEAAGPGADVFVNVNPKFFYAARQYVIDNVNGDLNLGADARELLALIKANAGDTAPALTTAVRDLEDPDTSPAARKSAGAALKRFLAGLSGKVEDTALAILEKYLESRLGL